jgi:hypothetical protein
MDQGNGTPGEPEFREQKDSAIGAPSKGWDRR